MSNTGSKLAIIIEAVVLILWEMRRHWKRRWKGRGVRNRGVKERGLFTVRSLPRQYAVVLSFFRWSLWSVASKVRGIGIIAERFYPQSLTIL